MNGFWNKEETVKTTLKDEDLMESQVRVVTTYFLGIKVSTNRYIIDNVFNYDTKSKTKSVGFGGK